MATTVPDSPAEPRPAVSPPSKPVPPGVEPTAPAVRPTSRPEPRSRQAGPVSLVRQPRAASVSLVKTPTVAPTAAVRDREVYDWFWAQTVPSAEAPQGPRPRNRGRLVAVAAVAALWLVTAAVSVAVISQTRSQDSEVLGTRFTDPVDQPPADALPDPPEVTETADIDDAGVVSLTQTLVWTDAVPAVLDVEPPDLSSASGVPDDVSAVLGQPLATSDGQPLAVAARPDGGWRITTRADEAPGSVVLTYQVSDALHRDLAAPPGRALAVIPLPPRSAAPDGPRQLSLPADKILNVSCPLPTDGAVTLCGSREGEMWVVTVPPEGNVVLAQMDLPAL